MYPPSADALVFLPYKYLQRLILSRYWINPALSLLRFPWMGADLGYGVNTTALSGHLNQIWFQCVDTYGLFFIELKFAMQIWIVLILDGVVFLSLIAGRGKFLSRLETSKLSILCLCPIYACTHTFCVTFSTYNNNYLPSWKGIL